MIDQRAWDIFHRIEADGVTAIDSFITNRDSEELFLDFKRASNDWTNSKLGDSDQKNFAKAISGFGNSSGGVIVWGVDCAGRGGTADVASKKFPIADPEAFKALLEGAVTGRTLPPHSKVRSLVVTDPAGGGFVVTIIPACTQAPLRSIAGDTYYLRSGSNFAPVPHGVLAGMFGRRPQAEVKLEIGSAGIHGSMGHSALVIDMVLHNQGAGIACSYFATLNINDTKACRQGCDSERWSKTDYGPVKTFLASNGRKLPPAGKEAIGGLEIALVREKITTIEIELLVGSDGGASSGYLLRLTSENLEKCCDIIEDESKFQRENPGVNHRDYIRPFIELTEV